MTTKKFTPTITRGPRLTPGEISLTPPDDLGIDIPPSGVQKILPYVMGGAMLGMIAIMVAGGTRQLSPYMLMMPLMMIVMMVGGLAGSTGGGGKKVPEINADRKEYLRYLTTHPSDVLGHLSGGVLLLPRTASRGSVVDRRHPTAVVPAGQRRLLCGHPNRYR